MPKYTIIKSRVVPVACFTALSVISGLASCGGSISSNGQPSGAPNIYVSASPAMIPYGAASTTSVITWTSGDGTSCTSSPNGINGASGSFTTPPLTKTTTYTVTCGGESKKVTIAVAPPSVVTPIAAQQTSCAAEPFRGTVYYYCDCGKGAAANCVAGDDNNAGTTKTAPRKTIANALSRYTGLTGTNTIAFCKGGAFDAATNLNASNTSCATGTTCTDFREYDPSPVFTSTAKPILNSASKGASLFTVAGGRGGIRFLNLKLHGTGIAGNDGIFIYNGAHDVMACNLDIDGFSMGVDQNPGSSATIPANTNITITGNNFTGNVRMAYWGGGPAAEISKNLMTNNGSGNTLDHTVYLSSQHFDAPNMRVSQNYMYGQVGNTCYGVVLVGHGKLIGLNILNNFLDIEEAADAPQCYGISLDSGGYLSQINFSSAVIAGNTLANTGYVGIAASNCADCLIEDNVITFNATTLYGISVGSYVSRSLYSDVINDRNTIRNNTIWFGPSSTRGGTGIQIKNEGTGHIVANNTVTYSSTSAGNGVNCFDYTLPTSSYAFINNNHCYSPASHTWDKTNGVSLAAWRAYSSGLDSASIEDPPMFIATTPPYDFHADPASPLQSAGTASSVPATDILGVTFTSPWDIGAYE